ncbi:hypothetical protein OIU74_005529 [Salix koriyanagi]|uniref:Uncharacterized protein n=1 Tax=Salix koriyanagi TaxID=2511006 RepID=A0A9Q0UPK8_9ROSI|nr:hypothetical protein OIU74_005529 [Salix koriyanagi]
MVYFPGGGEERNGIEGNVVGIGIVGIVGRLGRGGKVSLGRLGIVGRLGSGGSEGCVVGCGGNGGSAGFRKIRQGRPANKKTKNSSRFFVMNQGSIVAGLYRWRWRREDLSVICERWLV